MEATTSYSGSSRRSRRRRHEEVSDREGFLLRSILPAIRGRSCPICLATLEGSRAAVITDCLHGYCIGCIRTWSHIRRNCPLCNAEFGSWFFGISSRRGRFCEELLPPLDHQRNCVDRTDGWNSNRRIVQISQDEVAGAGLRTRPLPWRRSFGRPGSVPSEVIAERKLRWRLSVYKRRLRAVPLSSQSNQDMPVLRDHRSRERILNKIEPWIRRELEAILGDPDPSVIVHVVTSLFMEDAEKKSDAPIPVEEDNPAASLRPFLRDHADMFWHELRCFAKSSLGMETYDAVVEYRQFEER
ncbi:hypothetical protein MLD38_020515 [Melastoma candidum]|uniref:Uncharacterized protein n=1 Tax=Melastoma candidum TaxID=119954 RepID=A0ACB9QDA6_9MYRT|nr:hypothetical protein MLD38_020515 [Melastoma candidum]